MTHSEKLLFEELSIKHMDSVYTNAIRLTRSAVGAEYLVQKTYAYAFYYFKEFDKNSSFISWLNEILILVHINVHPNVQENNYLSSVQITV